MKIDDIYIVKVEKMLYEGKSLGKIDNIPVFIEGGCPEDLLKISLTKIKHNYLEGKIIEILEHSKHRVEPKCHLHNVCGSCNWQYIEYNEQLKQKTIILKETLKKITGMDFNINNTIPSPKIFEYRCKVQYPVSQTKNSGRILSGYYKNNSHELINIKYCPIQPEIINDMNEYLKLQAQQLGISAYNEKKHSGLLRHFIYKISSDEKNIMLVFVINSDKIPEELIKLSKIVKEKYTQLVSICANFNTKKTNVILGKESKVIIGKDSYLEHLENKTYQISTNSFFQVNPLSAVNIFNKIKELISDRIQNPTILDAYSGVSSIGIWLSDIASKVVCIEEVKSASMDAIKNVELNNLKNVEIINGDADQIFSELIKNNIKFNVSVIDPPRKGSTETALDRVSKLTSGYMIYVSCNPATLARDLKVLISKNFAIEFIQPFDMFPHTYHIETLVLLKKEAI